MNFVVLQFPASNCDQDAIHGVRTLGHSARYVWHKEPSLGDADAVIVPGGFSYGDYLRCGAIARFSPVMQAVKQFADNGGLVLGVCNGFQVLTEAGLLPGARLRTRPGQRRRQMDLRKRDRSVTEPVDGESGVKSSERGLTQSAAHGYWEIAASWGNPRSKIQFFFCSWISWHNRKTSVRP